MEKPAAVPPGSRPHSRWRRRLGRGLAVAVVLFGVLVAAHRPLLVGFARSFRVDDPMRADALVLLLGGDEDRARKAEELYHRGYAPLIVMGSDPDTEINRGGLLAAGVPARAISVLGPVGGTHDEAIQVRAYVRARAIHRITIVTTAYHTGRAHRTFRRVLAGTGVDVHMAASRADAFDESNWYLRSQGRTAYLREFAKSLYYRICF